jgi:phenylpropionate dioxygenase-like ring-hydroxylating dioxygenase large terminal subunit
MIKYGFRVGANQFAVQLRIVSYPVNKELSKMNGREYALDDWYPVAMSGELAVGQERHTQLLSSDITLRGAADGSIEVYSDGKLLQSQSAYQHIWTTFSEAPRPLFEIDEAKEVERRFVPCGLVRVKCSPLRAVENFLDIAHFPFVHTDVLGSEPHTEVYKYDVDISGNDSEVIASNIKFYQPQASKSAEGGIETEYTYRVPAAMAAILYKTCPPKPEFLDVIALFIQPIDEETCIAWPWMALYDDTSSMADLIQFQQLIFLQDRAILENQKPRKLPLDPGLEIPTRADLTSIAYRRWLRKRGAYYGAIGSA